MASAIQRRRRRRGNRSGIHINPANKGKLRASAGTPRGRKMSIAQLRRMKRSSNPKTRQRATFALNVRQGKIGGGRRRRSTRRR